VFADEFEMCEMDTKDTKPERDSCIRNDDKSKDSRYKRNSIDEFADFDFYQHIVEEILDRFPRILLPQSMTFNKVDTKFFGYILNRIVSHQLPSPVYMKSLCFRPMDTNNNNPTSWCLTDICFRHLLKHILMFIQSKNSLEIYAEMGRFVIKDIITPNQRLNQILYRISKLNQWYRFILVTELEEIDRKNNKEVIVRFIDKSYDDYIQCLAKRREFIEFLKQNKKTFIACCNCYPQVLGLSLYNARKKIPMDHKDKIPNSMANRKNYYRFSLREIDSDMDLRDIVTSLETIFHVQYPLKKYRSIIYSIWNESNENPDEFYKKLYDYINNQIKKSLS